jgi:predicted transcriptional regulator
MQVHKDLQNLLKLGIFLRRHKQGVQGKHYHIVLNRVLMLMEDILNISNKKIMTVLSCHFFLANTVF